MTRDETVGFFEMMREHGGRIRKKDFAELARISNVIDYKIALQGFDDALKRNMYATHNEITRAIWSCHNSINQTPSKKEAFESMHNIFSRMGYQA